MKYLYTSLILAVIFVIGTVAAELSSSDATVSETVEKNVERGYAEPCCTQYCYWKEICVTPTPTPTYYYYYYSRNMEQEQIERTVEKDVTLTEKSDTARGYFPTYYYYAPPTYYYAPPTYYYAPPTYYYYEYYTQTPTPTPTPECTYTQICQTICSSCPTPYYYYYEG
ncbi:hypothetical protein Gasu2_37770 [Galdieria sulphuraria]|uniref:Uncharacterized protein n=1 Tax=Galdieria sulphuraria TaxID=130081 RepID=M2XBW9_GALSU|nr:uncharacterized protein Gasu_51030 [Galdieria sulphuraria]EME27377.1 hypothetical protein Gasu_51030 [Galdieria sulphuraria]GJD09531.1 hypothetical protein Gasu2_37770 [Galdieria sulphuraria]|eukprot:XP_005703897.1 hypothetical protein Gasu_51030 [Galdieria sulphuraria]